MELVYDNDTIEECCNDLFNVADSKNLLQRKLGFENAKSIKKILGWLKSFPTFKNYLDSKLGKPHSLEGTCFACCYGVSINAHTRLIISPIPPDLSSEALKTCKKICIKGVVEYHGSKNEWLMP